MRYHLHTLPSTYPTIKRFLLAPPLFKPILGCKWDVGNNLALQIQASKNQCKELLLQKKQKHWASEILGSNTVCGPCWKPKAWRKQHLKNDTLKPQLWFTLTNMVCFKARTSTLQIKSLRKVRDPGKQSQGLVIWEGLCHMHPGVACCMSTRGVDKKTRIPIGWIFQISTKPWSHGSACLALKKTSRCEELHVTSKGSGNRQRWGTTWWPCTSQRSARMSQRSTWKQRQED